MGPIRPPSEAASLLGLAVLLVIALWVQRPQAVPLESYIVIDLGTPAESVEVEPALRCAEYTANSASGAV